MHNTTTYISRNYQSNPKQTHDKQHQQMQQNKPMHPKQMFQNLLKFNIASIQCNSKNNSVPLQKKIIQKLYLQYQTQIEKIKIQLQQQAALKQLKAKLLAQLNAVRNQRIFIDQRFTKQIQCFKLQPVQIRQNLQFSEQLQKIRQNNQKLSIRIRQLYDYIIKLQAHNNRLQQQRRVIISDNHIYDQSWRTRIQEMRKSQDQYMRQLKYRMRQKQLSNIRKIQQQQMGITIRNRNRMDSLKRSIHQRIIYH